MKRYLAAVRRITKGFFVEAPSCKLRISIHISSYVLSQVIAASQSQRLHGAMATWCQWRTSGASPESHFRAGFAGAGFSCWVEYDTHAAAGNYYRKWVVKLVALPTHQGPDEGRWRLRHWRLSTYPGHRHSSCAGLLYRDFLQSGERIRSRPVTETPSLKTQGTGTITARCLWVGSENISRS